MLDDKQKEGRGTTASLEKVSKQTEKKQNQRGNIPMGFGSTLKSLNTSLRSAAKRVSLGPIPTREIPPIESEIVLFNCSIFDGVHPFLKKNHTLLIKGGKILDCGHGNEIGIPAAFRTADAEGRTVMPGLIDAHVHQCSPFSYRPNRSTRRQMIRQIELNNLQTVNSGVTTVCDMGGPQGIIKDFTRLTEQNRIPGPRYLNCYTMISPMRTGKLGYPSQVKLLKPFIAWLLDGQVASRPRSLIDLKRLCYKVKEDGGTHLKTTYQSQPFSRKKHIDPSDFPVFGDDWLRCIFRLGRETGLPVAIHAPYRADAEKCVDLAIETGASIRLQHMAFDADLGSEHLRKMADHGIRVIPTAKVYGDAFHMAESVSWLNGRPEESMTPEAILQSKENIQRGIDLEPYSGQVVMEHDYAYFRDCFDTVKRNTQMAHEAGVIGIGTDSGGTYAGFFGRIHAEVMHYVRFGIPLPDIMKYLTSGNAEIHGLDDRGVIVKGKMADLILVDGDPLTDPTALTRIAAVIKGGVFLK